MYYARDFSDLVGLLALPNWSIRRTHLRHLARFLDVIFSGELEGGGDELQEGRVKLHVQHEITLLYDTLFGSTNPSDLHSQTTTNDKLRITRNYQFRKVFAARCPTPYSARPITETPAIRAQATTCLTALASPLCQDTSSLTSLHYHEALSFILAFDSAAIGCSRISYS